MTHPIYAILMLNRYHREKLRQEGHKFKYHLGNLARPRLKILKKGWGPWAQSPAPHIHTHTHTDYSMSYSKYKNEFNAKHGKKDGRAESNIH